MILLLASKKDLASCNIYNYLLETYNFRQSATKCIGGSLSEYQEISLLKIDQELVIADLRVVEEELKPDLIIVLSRHRAESGMPALLAHAQGNWTKKALLGGKSQTLSMTSASALKLAINALKEQKRQLGLESYLDGLEVTHHGPIAVKPMIFVEIGSSQTEWLESMPAKAVGEAAMNIARKWPQAFPSVVGIGGTHYAPRFNELITKTEYAVSHIIPKYYLDSVDLPMMLKQAVSKTLEQVKICAYDYSGTKSLHRKHAREAAEDLELDFVRIRDLLRGH